MNISVGTQSIFVGTRPAGGPGSRLREGIIMCLIAPKRMRYSKSRNASIGHLNLTLGARNVIWAFLFHFSFVSSASWLVLEGVMSTTHQAVITLSRIVFSCDRWLRHAVPISRIRIIHLHEFFFISWASSCAKDDCYVGCTHHLLQDNLKLIVCSMFTVPNVKLQGLRTLDTQGVVCNSMLAVNSTLDTQ